MHSRTILCIARFNNERRLGGNVDLTEKLQQERNASWVQYPQSLYIFESHTQVAA